MNSFGYFAIATVITGAALLYLRATDSKRARVFRRNAVKSSKAVRLTIGIVVWVPGALLLWLRQYSAFISWCGALLVFGWAIAANAPAGTTADAPDLGDADGS